MPRKAEVKSKPQTSKTPTLQVKTTLPRDLNTKDQGRAAELVEESNTDLAKQISRLQQSARAKRGKK